MRNITCIEDLRELARRKVPRDAEWLIIAG
jgi:hypothetical protein